MFSFLVHLNKTSLFVPHTVGLADRFTNQTHLLGLRYVVHCLSRKVSFRTRSPMKVLDTFLFHLPALSLLSYTWLSLTPSEWLNVSIASIPYQNFKYSEIKFLVVYVFLLTYIWCFRPINVDNIFVCGIKN